MKAIDLHRTAAVCVSFAICAFATAANPPVPIAAASDETAAEASATRWSDIKDHSHEMRTEFFAGLKRLEARLDVQIAGLAAKRATMKGATGTREWDLAVKELESAQSYFKAVGAELAKADSETWAQEKEKVGRAWASTQDAYGKVKRSTTS